MDTEDKIGTEFDLSPTEELLMMLLPLLPLAVFIAGIIDVFLIS